MRGAKCQQGLRTYPAAGVITSAQRPAGSPRQHDSRAKGVDLGVETLRAPAIPLGVIRQTAQGETLVWCQQCRLACVR